MKDELVVVGFSRTDSSTESCQASLNEKDIWIFSLPHDASELAESTIKKLDPKVCENVHTVITCSAADDSYARNRIMTTSRGRPRDVLAALGINVGLILKNYLPNVQNIFKAEAATPQHKT